MRSSVTKQILDKALKLEVSSELYVTCKTSKESDFLYSDLRRHREQTEKYESVVFRQNGNTVTLTKQDFTSVWIRKIDGSREDITF